MYCNFIIVLRANRKSHLPCPREELRASTAETVSIASARRLSRYNDSSLPAWNEGSADGDSFLLRQEGVLDATSVQVKDAARQSSEPELPVHSSLNSWSCWGSTPTIPFLFAAHLSVPMSAFTANHQVFVRSPYLSWPDVCIQEPCVSRNRHSPHPRRGVPPDPNWHHHRHTACPSRNRDVDICGLPNGPVFSRFQDPTVVKDPRRCASAYRWRKGEH